MQCHRRMTLRMRRIYMLQHTDITDIFTVIYKSVVKGTLNEPL